MRLRGAARTVVCVMVATGRGATEGVLFKNAEALEILEKVDTLVVDKTGTLTEGKPRLVSVTALDGFTEVEVLRLAASLELGSEHPLAAAIVAGAEERKVTLATAEDFKSVTGRRTLTLLASEGSSYYIALAGVLYSLNRGLGDDADRRLHVRLVREELAGGTVRLSCGSLVDFSASILPAVTDYRKSRRSRYSRQ